jgi:hypothetical protein
MGGVIGEFLWKGFFVERMGGLAKRDARPPGFRYSPPTAHSISGSNRPLNPWPMPARSFVQQSFANRLLKLSALHF